MNTKPENEFPGNDVEDSPLQSAESIERENSAAEKSTEEVSTGSVPTVESLQAQLADAEKRILLAQADLENFRRRTRRDVQDQIRYASIGLIGELLEAVDNLNRAIEAHKNDSDSAGLAEGVHLVVQQISTALANHGCKKIDAVGQPFDPTLHQAVTMQESDEHPANTVLMDLRPGFQLHDRVIRPSQVIVAGEK